MQSKVMKPQTTETFNGDGTTTLEVKNDTSSKGEYDVTPPGAINVAPTGRNVYIFPNTKETWNLVPNAAVTVTNMRGTTLIVTRY